VPSVADIEQAVINDLVVDAWTKGDLYYKLQDHQLDVYEFLRTRQNLTCSLLLSRRFGKTHICFTLDVEDCLRTPGARIAYFYPTQKQGKEILFPIYDIVFEDAPGSQKAVWNDQMSCYTFPNGSKIFIFGCENKGDVDRHRGPKYSAIRIDEAGVHGLLKYLYKSVLLPTLLTMKDKPLITFLGTPALFFDHEFRYICDFTAAKGDLIVRTISDNSSISEETKEKFIDESGGYESTETLREYFCKWVTDSRLVIIPEWNDKYIQTPEKEPEYKFYHHYVACDWGLGDKTAIMYATWDFKRAQLVIEAEQTLTNLDAVTSNIALLIKVTSEKLWPSSKVYRYIGDSNNAQIIQDLNVIYGLPFIGTTKSNMSDNPEHIKIKQSMVNSLRESVKRAQFIIEPQCKETIGNFRSGIWNKNYSSFERTEEYGHFDLLDAAIYLDRNVDRTTNPIPDNFYWNSQQAQIRTQAKPNAYAGALGVKNKTAVERI